VIVYLAAILCVAGLAAGQILFKVSAVKFNLDGHLTSVPALVALLAAVLLYGLTSVAWVWVLRHVELGRVYPLMALAFVIVPLGSHFVFGERFSTQYVVGVCLIVLGIAIAARA
jgi:drug/metabolite transporter (DMT)-like permease